MKSEVNITIDRKIYNTKIMDEKDAVFLSNPLRLKILSLISRGVGTAYDISKELNEDLYNIYYHLRSLEKSGLVSVEKEERRGFVAKYHTLKYDALLFLLNKGRKLYTEKTINIVVGSPDAHGKFDLRARDGFLAGYVGNYLGIRGYNVRMFLDTLYDIDKNEEEDVVICIGGPLTNTFTYKLNKLMKIRFDERSHYRTIVSDVTKKHYSDESVGIMIKIHYENKKYIVLSGTSLYSTEGVIYVFGEFVDTFLNNDLKEEYYVVNILDKNSDGKPDDYEILEEYESK